MASPVQLTNPEALERWLDRYAYRLGNNAIQKAKADILPKSLPKLDAWVRVNRLMRAPSES